MTAGRTLDDRIRSMVLELVDAAPAPPVLELEAARPRPSAERARRAPSSSRRPRRALASITVGVVLVSVLLAMWCWPRGSSEVSEAALGMRLVSDVGSSPPVLAPVPEGYVPIGSGTFFGRPWTVSAAPHPDRRLCVAFGYAGVALGSTCGVPFDQLAGMPPSARPVRPAWARSSFVLGLDTSSDGQRFLYVATNGEVTSLTVRAGGGAFVRGTALPRHLGDVSYFVLSLGRPHGACHELCQGTVSVRFATAHGPTLVDGQGQLLAQDHGGNGGFLSAPVRS